LCVAFEDRRLQLLQVQLSWLQLPRQPHQHMHHLQVLLLLMMMAALTLLQCEEIVVAKVLKQEGAAQDAASPVAWHNAWHCSATSDP
jgi:hypothetical protein